MNSCLPTRLLSLVLIALAATSTLHAAQVALVADASVNSTRPSTNFGGLSNLYIGNGSTTLLRFALDTLPAGTSASQISRATLTIFVNRVNAAGSVTLSPVTSVWTESAVSDDTIPTIAVPAASFTAATAGQFITIDVTAIVQGWVTTPATDFGFALSSPSANLLLDSKENDETGHAASLDITITSEGATGLQGLQGIEGPVGPVGPQGLVGPVGIPGPQGIQGVAGPVGPTGLIGTTGMPGAIGPVGPTGMPGTAGTTGAPGIEGTTGANGAAGAIGPAGSNGANGAIGATGTFNAAGNWSPATTYQGGQVVFCAACSTNGSSYIAIATNTNQDPPTQTAVWNLVAQAGATGTDGISGTNGLSGATGATGPAGAAGAPGPTGATGFAGATGATGPQGPVGAQGMSGANGATGATGATGSLPQVTAYSSATTYAQGSVVVYQGSTYQSVSNTNVNNLPTNPTFWTLTAQAGATGAAGATGSTGIAGANGAPGTPGAIGATGAAGAIGPVGATGSTGTAGTNGAPGTPGANGASGAVGATGPVGATGSAGTNGAPGTPGANGASGAAGATGAPGPFVGGTYFAAINYPAGSVVDYASSTYLAVQANGSSTPITPGTNSAYWVATSGSASGSTTPASYIDVSETVASATVAIGAEVFAVTSAPFPLVASNSGFTFNPTTGTVTVAAAGIYTYDYDVSVDEPGVLALTDNGVFVPGTSFGRSTGTTQIIGHGQIALNAGDVVGLISDGSAAALTLYGITTFQNIAAFSLVAITAGTSGATGPQGPQGVPGVNGLTGATGTGAVDSIAVGTVTTSGSAGTVSIGGTATTPTITINFPANSGSSAGFVWTTSFQVSTDVGPDNVNPLTGAIGIVPTSGTQIPEFAFAPVSCTATSLRVYAAEVGLPFPPGQIIVTAQDNGTNTSMSCQLEPSLPGFLPASSCSSTNTFSVNAGDEIQYSLTQMIPPQAGTSSFGQVGTTLTCQNQ